MSHLEKTDSFAHTIEAAQSAEKAPTESTRLVADSGSAIDIRHRGCFITECSLVDPVSGEPIDILYSDPDIETPKLSASHVMSPVGPSEGIGGQHGFARWADYHPFTQEGGPNGEKRVAFQAKRSDQGLGLIKVIELTSSGLSSSTSLLNSEEKMRRTSLGEHYYFKLERENPNGLEINGKTLDELLGKDAKERIMHGEPLFWSEFDGQTTIKFPAGYNLELTTQVEGADLSQLGMLVWHRPGTESICFEPTLGFEGTGKNQEVAIDPYEKVTLHTSINLLDAKERIQKKLPEGVRFVQPDDIDSVLPILKQSIVHPITKEPFEGEIEETIQSIKDSLEGNNQRQYLIIESDNEVVGVMGLQKAEEKMKEVAVTDNPCELINAFVASSEREKDHGRKLVQGIEELAQLQGYTEIVVNSGPRYMRTGWPFWDKLYGKRIITLKDYYGPRFHAPVWSKMINSKK